MKILLLIVFIFICSAAFADSESLANMLFPVLEKKQISEDTVSVIEDFSPGCTKFGSRCAGGLCILGGQEYSKGIGANSPSHIKISLTAPAVGIKGLYGLDRSALRTPGSCEFIVKTDNKEVFHSDIIRGDDKAYNLDLTFDETKEINLIVTDGGDGCTCDHADWADLEIIFADGSRKYVNDIAKNLSVSSVPFSFVLGGVSSREFLADWEYEAKDREKEDRIIRTCTWTKNGIELKAVVQIYKNTSGVDYTLYLTNTGRENTPIISNMRALDIDINLGKGDRTNTKYAAPDVPQAPDAEEKEAPVLYRQEGSVGMVHFTHNEFMPITDNLLADKKITFGTSDAYSSSGAFPFWNLSMGNCGLITALGWTGQWDAELANNKGSISQKAGMTVINTVLYPGETIRSPRVLLCPWNGALEESWNSFRKTMLAYIVPRYKGEIQREPMFHMCSCFNDQNNTTYEIEKSYIDTITKFKLPFEVYWLDAWWHKGGFPDGLGNYVYPLETNIDMERFPEGVKGISDYAHKNGLKIMCWFAPEAMSAKSLLAKEHPEWVLPKGAPTGCFNLGIPEALDYMANYMNTCIKEWNLDIWRTDIGYTLGGIREMEKDTPDRIGILEIRQVEGLYELWDRLLAANPGLIIDNCCGGGGRIDLETCARAIPIWRTDSGNFTAAAHNLKDMAIQNQDINSNLNLYVPQNTGQAYDVLPYYIRSAFNGGFIYGEDNRGEEFDNKTLKIALEEVKRLRKYTFGDFYKLVFKGEGYDEWCSYQYNRPEEGDGAVFAFRRDESPIVTMELKLKAIDPKAMYEVKIYGESYKTYKKQNMKGEKLSHIFVTIKDAPASALIEYKKIK